jgi:hypothetical protein
VGWHRLAASLSGLARPQACTGRQPCGRSRAQRPRACQATARTDRAAAVAAPAAASKGARTWRRYPRSSTTSSMPPRQSAKP